MIELQAKDNVAQGFYRKVQSDSALYGEVIDGYKLGRELEIWNNYTAKETFWFNGTSYDYRPYNQEEKKDFYGNSYTWGIIPASKV